MDTPTNEIDQLRRLIAALTERVYRLEQAAGLEPAQPAPLPAEPIVSETPPSPPPSPNMVNSTTPRQPTVSEASELESQIGAHWFNRVGIVAVFIGAASFLKYAFDNEWIGPAARVLIGLLAGVGTVIWSEQVRSRGYQLFSFSLKALGIGILFLSLWASSQLYQLVPGSLAFLAMVSVTAATVAMALWQDAQILAAFALVGGFITPVLLSTGVNREISLFTYVAVLDLGVLALAAVRPWRHLLVGSYVGTVALYVGWLSRYYTTDQFAVTVAFATVFYAIFATVPFLVKTERLSRTVVTLVLLNAAVYFLQVHELLRDVNEPAAWVAAALGGVYFGFARQLRGIHYPVLTYLHDAIAAGFVAIAIALKLEAHWITIGWFIEAGALFWISRRTQANFLKALGGGALALGILRLLLIDDFETTRLFFNGRVLTFGVAIVVLSAVVRIGVMSQDAIERRAGAIALVAINVLALFALNQEVSDFFERRIQSAPKLDYRSLTTARDFTYSAVWMVYGAVLMFAGFWKKSAFLRWQALILITATIAKVFIYDLSFLDRAYRILSFIALGIVLLAISFFYQRRRLIDEP